MIDSVFEHLQRALELEPWAEHELVPGTYALVTLHRPALVDDPRLLAATLAALRELGDQIPTIFPVHPRTRARIADLGLDDSVGRLRLIEPIGYLPFLGLQARARLILTDSGGIQEEASALGVPCFTLRDSTERPVTVTHGTNTLLGARPERISEIVDLVSTARTTTSIPLWDGHAGDRAAEALLAYLASPS